MAIEMKVLMIMERFLTLWLRTISVATQRLPRLNLLTKALIASDDFLFQAISLRVDQTKEQEKREGKDL